jgi:hypothetical protein
VGCPHSSDAAELNSDGVPFIATWLTTLIAGVPLIGLLYPMAVAAVDMVVGSMTVRERTHDIRIWDGGGGNPDAPLVPDQP